MSDSPKVGKPPGLHEVSCCSNCSHYEHYDHGCKRCVTFSGRCALYDLPLDEVFVCDDYEEKDFFGDYTHGN